MRHTAKHCTSKRNRAEDTHARICLCVCAVYEKLAIKTSGDCVTLTMVRAQVQLTECADTAKNDVNGIRFIQ